MLHSWIERAQKYLSPATSAGIFIGRDVIGLAEIVVAESGWQVQSLSETRLERPLFSGPPSADVTTSLADALKKISGGIANRYVPVHVSFPDAAVRVATFELDDLPKARSAQLDLVRFRFGREAGGDAGVCAYQSLGTDGNKHLLFGAATDSAWQRCINDAFAQAGIVAWSSSANAARQFNRFHDRLTQTSGALISLTPDAWSLWLWDAQGRPRYTRARWRSATDDHADIAMDVERSILAYVHGHPERIIVHVYVVAGAETDNVAAALDVRLREPCVKLSSDDAVSYAESVNRNAASVVSSLAAALER